MLNCYSLEKKDAHAISLVPVNAFSSWMSSQPTAIRTWLAVTQFQAEAGAIRVLPDKEGRIQKVICCVNNLNDWWSVGNLAYALPEGNYYFDVAEESYASFAIAFGLGAYQFCRYKKPKRNSATLFLSSTDEAHVNNVVSAIYLVRDCINTPTDDMGPSELAEVTKKIADAYQASFNQIIGDDLLKQNYGAIYTVGRASDDAPRLLDLEWGNPAHPKVTLVGKGVCFDTGGLDLKPAQAMQLMKKDMAGGAHVLGLAQMIMQAKLPVRLRVLIPAVENAVSGNAYRPGDIITSRKGLTIEIGNTDAEGRLVLADALTEAMNDKPDLLIDISTLTGAARIALGTELPAVFSNNDAVVNDLIEVGRQVSDPMWRLPLFPLYREYLNSPIADLNNCSSESYGGAITAALFLQAFVSDDIPWLHFDIMAWNLRARPGRPQGGEAMALRALFYYLKNRFASIE